jgi:hypothetical protein
MVGIYKITSPTGKVYVGQSLNIADRKSSYKGFHCTGQSAIYNSLKKYGWLAHVFEVICELPEDVAQEVLNSYEIYYWEQYKECNIETLNAKEPGKGGKHLVETKQKISITKQGSKHSEKTKQKISSALKGRLPVTPKRAVQQYTKEGVFIREFNSQTAAALFLGVRSSSAICKCCQGKMKSYKDFIWKFKLNTL